MTNGQVILVSTPIGNLDDLAPRGVTVLQHAAVIACEDTRHTGRLLTHFGITTPMVALHEHNEAQRAEELVMRAVQGDVIAVVSDAGTPGVSDPGFVVVRAAVAAGVTVTAVPGPSALIHALVISGMPTDRFAFEGFLPRKAGARRDRLMRVATDDRTLIFYVSPHRAAEDLNAMAEVFGMDRPAALTRELTKMFEEVWRGTVGDLAERAAASPPRGEVTVVVAGLVQARAPMDDQEIALRLAELVSGGMSRRDAVRQVVDETGLSKRHVYDLATG